MGISKGISIFHLIRIQQWIIGCIDDVSQSVTFLIWSIMFFSIKSIYLSMYLNQNTSYNFSLPNLAPLWTHLSACSSYCGSPASAPSPLTVRKHIVIIPRILDNNKKFNMHWDDWKNVDILSFLLWRGVVQKIRWEQSEAQRMQKIKSTLGFISLLQPKWVQTKLSTSLSASSGIVQEEMSSMEEQQQKQGHCNSILQQLFQDIHCHPSHSVGRASSLAPCFTSLQTSC